MAIIDKTLAEMQSSTDPKQTEAIDSPDNAGPRRETRLRKDGETDTLYDDGLDVEDNSETLADTHGERGTGN